MVSVCFFVSFSVSLFVNRTVNDSVEYNEEKSLLDKLMRGYDPDVRPIRNSSLAIVIKLSITLTQIFDMVSGSSDVASSSSFFVISTFIRILNPPSPTRLLLPSICSWSLNCVSLSLSYVGESDLFRCIRQRRTRASRLWTLFFYLLPQRASSTFAIVLNETVWRL